MLFNSFEYILFLPTVFIIYWFILNKHKKYQNLLILISSYIFYGWWDYRFLSLILLSTIVDYFIGIKIYNKVKLKERKILLWCSIIFNLSVLCFFKYFNFFIDSWIELFDYFGYQIKSIWTLKIILPVGISFYTFQTMSYTIDIYRKKLKPTKDFISLASFISFFPQLVAGPIERATNLLPQILKKRRFNYNQGVQGLRLILWGMFKKVVVADSLAPISDNIFLNYQTLDGGTLILGAIYFSFQIYCDFSGYSDIAIGTAKLFGIELMSNFKFPYFSRNIGEFWRKWHVSLSSWFRDYLYIPLGGSRKSIVISIRNIFIIFIVSGFWHGANWTFIVWGLFHSILFLPSFFLKTNRKYLNEKIAENNFLPSLKDFYNISLTFSLVTLGWIFFRSENISNSLEYINKIFFEFNIPESNRSGLIFIIPFVVVDYLFRKDERSPFNFKNKTIRYLFYIVFTLLCISFLNDGSKNFIYFVF